MTPKEAAEKAGFRSAYLLPVPEYKDWTRRRQDGAFAPQADYLAGDAALAYPWANALLLLVWPYTPLKAEEGVSGYYLASNQSYHALNALQETLREQSVPNEKARVPLRFCANRRGIGSMLQNGLLAIEPYGTRFVLQGLMLQWAEPAFDGPFPKKELCLHCGLCEMACPGQAVGKNGFAYERCLRTYMEGEPMPPWVMEKLPALLGCELCQSACPLNSGQASRSLTEQERAAFALERLLAGEQSEALALVGKNMKKSGKLLSQAAVLAAKEGRRELLPQMEALLPNAPEGLRESLLWAISLLKKPR